MANTVHFLTLDYRNTRVRLSSSLRINAFSSTVSRCACFFPHTQWDTERKKNIEMYNGIKENVWERPPDCCFSYEAEGALGRDELENDAEEDGIGRDARGQPAIRGEKERGGGLVGANGDSAWENAGRRPHRRRSRGPAPGTKGTYIRIHISLSFLLAFFSLLSSETRPVFHINPSSRGKPTAPLGGSPSLSLLRPSMARATGRTEGDHRLIAPIRVD